MKLKKLGKSCLSLFLACGMLMPVSNVNVYKSNVYAAGEKSAWDNFASKTASRTLADLIGRTVGDIFFRFLDAFGLLDLEAWFIHSRYGEDLTESAREGKLHDCIERDKEIDDMLHFLLNEDKGNIMITGPAGAGKTALVEGLAYRIAKGDVPEYFKNKRIIRINMVSLIAGNTYTGSDRAAARVRAMLEAAERDPDIILFIDEFHQMAKINVADLFKTFLERGRVKMIAATTTAEYEYIKKDEAVVRRFTPVVVNEMTKEQTLNVLNSLKPEIQNKYNVRVSNDAISAIVEYTDKYMRNKTFPDKAISVLYTTSKMASVENQNAAVIPVVTRDDIISFVSREVRIPLGNITSDEQRTLDSLEKRVKNTIIGQDKAVKKLCKAVKNSRSEIKNYNKPHISLFFTGTSGVGKRKLAEAVGKEIDSFIEVDFSNYTGSDAMEQLFSSKIFGYNGRLAEKISRKPYSVVFFDNLEKAHPNTIKSVLSIIRKGYTLDSKGNEVDFRNAFVVINSKIGEKEMLECKSCQPTDEVTAKIDKKIIEKFGEDFFDSLDDVVVFNKLDKDSVKKILDINLNDFEKTLDYKNIEIKVPEEVREFLYNLPIDHKFGMESIDKYLFKYIIKPLNKANMNETIKENSVVNYVLKDGKVELEVE